MAGREEIERAAERRVPIGAFGLVFGSHGDDGAVLKARAFAECRRPWSRRLARILVAVDVRKQ